MRRPPIDENEGLRGGDRGGAHDRPLFANVVEDDSVSVGAGGADWNREEYTDEDGQDRIRMTRRR